MRKPGGAPAPPPAFPLQWSRAEARQEGRRSRPWFCCLIQAQPAQRRSPCACSPDNDPWPRKAPSAALSNGRALAARPPATPRLPGTVAGGVGLGLGFACSKSLRLGRATRFAGRWARAPHPPGPRKRRWSARAWSALRLRVCRRRNDPVTAHRGSQRRRCCPRSTLPTICCERLSRAAAEPAFAYGYT